MAQIVLTKVQRAALEAMRVAPCPAVAFAYNREHEVAGTVLAALRTRGLAQRIRIGRRWYGEITAAGLRALAQKPDQ